jgi:4-hydroxybenzoate polyprenyltransferase
MRKKIMGFARLARPANLPTAAADILAGAAIADFFSINNDFVAITDDASKLILLVVSSICLYAGGVVFNDVFDAKLDAVERPERAIPSGVVSLRQALLWGSLLILVGLILAFNVTLLSGIIALVLAASIFSYDAFFKHNVFFGPLNMGICRGLNLMLGMSIIGAITTWWVAIIPVLYIFAITLISRGEVHGNNKNHIIKAAVMYIVVVVLLTLAIGIYTTNLQWALPFLILFIILIFRPLLKAYRINSPEHIKKSVIAGVVSLVVLDACWAAGFSNIYVGLAVLLLLPLSLVLSKLFAVT